MFKIGDKVRFTKSVYMLSQDVDVDGLLGRIIDGPHESYVKVYPKGFDLFYFVDFDCATELCYEGELSYVQTQLD
ncbi:hypothetical protein UFOVP59_37 [uncultured Caudovirales phage]|uniref:Uncharacterized protein n=1 Tax=uncultured Caudovirales phage TaxID=2100421 RepID=A0A6J7WSL0_9CAUD|nr:hypothetical protein UFOVP59_37 [uncultured Caudovirales phage]CAB5221069.1 hypothetical protein UFOVP246_78 [uncultured Caudovirales phage]